MEFFKLFNFENYSDINFKDGQIVSDGSLYTSVYIALFGGSSNFWGNSLTNNLPKVGGTFYPLLQASITIDSSLNELKTAIENDLQPLVDYYNIKDLEVHLESVDGIRINAFIGIVMDGDTIQKFTFDNIGGTFA